MSEILDAIRDVNLCLLSYEHVTHRHKNEQLHVQRDADSVFIAIAGSNDRRDWHQNFSSWWQRSVYGNWYNRWDKHMATHGYVVAARNCLNAVQKSIMDRDKIYVTGHSKGGAVAPVFALIAQSEGYNIRGVRTFAAPKFSLSDLDLPLINGLKRYRCRSDYIPEWPEPWFNDWSHHGKEYLIGEEVDEHPGVVRDAYTAHTISHYVETVRSLAA